MKDIKEQLILHEGLSLTPYKCSAGKWTIGVGHNYQDTGIPRDILKDMLFEHYEPAKVEVILKKEKITTDELTKYLAKGISKELAMRLLYADILKYEAQIRKEISWYDTLDPVRQKVMLDMTFNMGIGWIKKFKNTVELIRQGKFNDAGLALEKSLWAKQVKTRADRLIRMMKTGIDYEK